mmetsp:Transcript_11666/g.23234  ORF Transcript_11666/g.23234 Transcript_11666/m.23234 type:complete len:326 (+) Transcript_11666:289-1266(+)
MSCAGGSASTSPDAGHPYPSAPPPALALFSVISTLCVDTSACRALVSVIARAEHHILGDAGGKVLFRCESQPSQTGRRRLREIRPGDRPSCGTGGASATAKPTGTATRTTTEVASTGGGARRRGPAVGTDGTTGPATTARGGCCGRRATGVLRRRQHGGTRIATAGNEAGRAPRRVGRGWRAISTASGNRRGRGVCTAPASPQPDIYCQSSIIDHHSSSSIQQQQWQHQQQSTIAWTVTQVNRVSFEPIEREDFQVSLLVAAIGFETPQILPAISSLQFLTKQSPSRTRMPHSFDERWNQDEYYMLVECARELPLWKVPEWPPGP